MTPLEDLIKNLPIQVRERISSPLLASFVVSWCLWNYKFLVILFSDATVSRTFNLIEAFVFPDTRALICNGVIYPLLTCLGYIFLYPYPARRVYQFTRQKQKEILEIRRRIENETPLTLEESRRIRAEIERIEQAYLRDIQTRDREIEKLKSELAETKRNPDELQSPPEKTSAIELSPSQLVLLENISELKQRATDHALLQRTNEPDVKTEYNLGELQRLGLIERGYNGEYDLSFYQLTHQGRAYLVKHIEQNA